MGYAFLPVKTRLAWVCLPFASAWLASRHSHSHGNANQTIDYGPYQKIRLLAEALARPPVLGVTLRLCLAALASLSCSTVPLPVTFRRTISTSHPFISTLTVAESPTATTATSLLTSFPPIRVAKSSQKKNLALQSVRLLPCQFSTSINNPQSREHIRFAHRVYQKTRVVRR